MINVQSFMKLLQKISNWYFSKSATPYWVILCIDCLVVLFSSYFAYVVDYDIVRLVDHLGYVTLWVIPTLIPYLIFFRVFHTYSGIIRYSSFIDLARIAGASICAVATLFVCGQLGGLLGLPTPTIKFCAVVFATTTLMMWLLRVAVKMCYDIYRTDENTQRVYIYGVREGGVAIAKSIQNQEPRLYRLVGFVNPEEKVSTKFIMGVQLRRVGPNLIKHMKDDKVKAVIVNPRNIEDFRERHDLINELMAADIKILVMQDAEAWDGKSDFNHGAIRHVEIEDLLPREKIEVDMEAIGKLLSGRKILITGAAGSIGSEMVRQVAKFKPAEMILIDQAETPMHDIRLMMAAEHSDIRALTIVSSITNKEHMEKIFSDHRPDYVFHAAAYKHVPMMEDNPALAVQNNIYGTRVIADLSVKYGTKKFVMISTDKAVNPTNVMGCSKRICEIYCQSLSKAIADGKGPKTADGSPAVTQFVTTRFGNVLGSNGSVIPIFRRQIREGGPITVTHPDIIRFFMLIPEACKLVLEAGTMGHGGEIFVFDMGKPVRIVDLAKRMISLSGAKNISIKITGLRDGEKLYEEVLSDEENTAPTPHKKIKVARVREYDYETAVHNEERLLEVSRTFDDMAIVKLMKEIVPEYKSRSSKYEALDK